ncbi:MAG: hypothetical protein WDM78_18675 [Puia sp.]
MGERPGKGFNVGILYLAFTRSPLVEFWVIGGGGKTANHSIHKTCMIKIFDPGIQICHIKYARFFRFYSNLE